MTAQLESRYRRLIALYPPGHRAVYAEDMINVLMAGAPAGQQRPHLRTGADLVRGAAAAWALRLRSGGRVWLRGSAPAAIAVLALLMLSIQSITAAGRVLDDAPATPPGRWDDLVLGLPDLIWLPVLVAAGIGLRRPAAWTAWVVGISWPVLDGMGGLGGWVPDYLGRLDSPLWVAIALIAAAGLSVDGSTRRGFQALGRSGSGAAIAGALMIGVATNLSVVADALGPWPNRVGPPLLATGLALVVLACAGAVTRTGRARAQVTVLAVAIHLPLSAVFAWRDGGSWYSDLQEQVNTTLPLILLICGLIVAWSTVHAAGRPARLVPSVRS